MPEKTNKDPHSQAVPKDNYKVSSSSQLGGHGSGMRPRPKKPQGKVQGQRRETFILLAVYITKSQQQEAAVAPIATMT